MLRFQDRRSCLEYSFIEVLQSFSLAPYKHIIMPKKKKNHSSTAEGATRRTARKKRFWRWIIPIAHIMGLFTSVQAIMESRTPQGAIAWGISLNTVPYVAVPAYWVFGRSKFQGYVVARQEEIIETNPIAQKLRDDITSEQFRVEAEDSFGKVLTELGRLPYTRRNHADLLIDGEATFDAIFKAIDEAEDYILVQFYIIRDDDLGRKLKNRLIARAKEGIRVFFLYDAFGSVKLPMLYIRDLNDAGIQVQEFRSTRYQLNFRNHRKIVVVDGKVAFVGGHNVGDEYLGNLESMSPWRDTHLQISGPIVQCIQIPFIEDWHWTSGEFIRPLNWDPDKSPEGSDMEALCLPTGPADEFETCNLFFLAAINSAKKRAWIASPYFVPDEPIISALQLAALRGVDVRVLIPEKPDSKLVGLSAFSYLPDMEKADIQVYRYTQGFLHQKVILIDDDFAAVGTANFDNRSFRLNFEVTVAVHDTTFASQVDAMLRKDFSQSNLASAKDLEERGFPFRFAVRVSRLLAPIQ